ncbi:DUF6090 family protein [Litoribaculum gwangyangense]|uniref:Uncharacterized protein n=1 Tax=Litoribaculum gwangyangense TaxID=1130722 RepID=A0ABP9CUV9_9FLAO
MIKFFRNIRQKLLNEGKTANYLKYALGEIILVVIGILIALQINNWNEKRKEKAFETEMLQSFKESLSSDLSDIEYNIKQHIKGLAACDSILIFLKPDIDVNIDTLSTLFADAFFVTRFVYSTSAFESLKAKGVNIISNKSLQKKIVDVYDSRYRFFAVSENDFIENYWLGIQHIFPTRFEEGLNYDLNSKGYPGSLKPRDVEALKNDKEFIYYLKTNRNWTNLIINFHYEGLKSNIVELLDLIDKELKLNNNL